MAFPAGWTRRAPIVISAVGSDLVDFPVHLDAACFPAETLDNASVNKAKADGGDLRFSADSDGAVELASEVRRWVQDASPANVRAEVHVKVPALSRSTTTTIYVWYANAAATKPAATDPNGSQAVWDSGFVGVYHLDNTSSVENSTGGTAGTPEGAIAATAESPVGLAIDLDGVNDAIAFGTSNANNSTLEIVVKPDAITDQIVIGKSGGSPASYSKGIWVSASKPTAFFETSSVLPYDMTVADSINAQTANYEHWVIRNRASDAVTMALPAVNQTHQARCSDGTYIYSIGGHSGNPSAPVTSHQRYDPAGNSWTTLTAAPAARWGAACVHLAGKIYFMGGATNPSTVSSRNDIYDIAGNSWSVGAALPAALTASVIQGHRACTDGTYVYVFAGPSVQRYDPVGDSWAAITTMPVSPGTWQSLICTSGSIYVIGGSNASTAVYRYDISGAAWDGAAWDAAPYGAWAHVCEPVGDGSWLFGFGRYPSGNEQSRALYRYTPATKTWAQLDPYDLGGNAFASGIIGGKLYVFGAWFVGRREDLTFGHHACYSITSGAWETAPAAMDFVRDGIGVGGMLSSAPFYTSGAQLYIGRQDGYGSLFSGAKVSEMRNSSVARSRDWLIATKQTLLSASIFSVVGAAETPPLIIALAGVGMSTALGSASPSVAVAMSAIGYMVSSGTADISAGALGELTAAGAAQAGGAAQPVANVTISAAGLAQAAGQAGLSAAVLIAGAGAARAAGNAALAATLSALALGAAQAGGSATLSGGSAGSMDAAGGAQAAGAAGLVATVSFAAAGGATAGGSAAVSGGAAGGVSAAGEAQTAGQALVSVEVAITASGFVQAMAIGYLVVQVPLEAVGAALSDGSATLVDADSQVLIEDRRFVVDASGRTFVVANWAINR